MSLYFNEEELQPLIFHDPAATLQTTGDTLLSAHQTMQFPHVDALFRYGEPALQQWMADLLGQAPEALLTQSDIGAPEHPALDQLDQRLRAAHPMWVGGTVAQLGGWCWG
ncbi:hypothetical protein GCM10008949_24370 [Deinococcus humi]|nr:hypothetical protein GCM10008949_24370 [Deinococcus humi]